MSPGSSRPLPAPFSPDDLLDRPVHVVVRDYPEVLGVLRREGLELGAAGGVPLRSLGEAEALAARLVDVTGWRRTSAGVDER